MPWRYSLAQKPLVFLVSEIISTQLHIKSPFVFQVNNGTHQEENKTKT